MKTIKILLLAFLVVTLSSCSKDDKPDPALIVGKWSITEGSFDGGTMILDIGGMSVPVEYSGNFIDISPNNFINFKSDNTFDSSMENITVEVTVTVMGITQTESMSADNIFGEGTWSQNGNTLTVKNEESTINYNIDSFDGTNLYLSGNVKDIMLEGGSNPMLESMDIKVRMTLKKIS